MTYNVFGGTLNLAQFNTKRDMHTQTDKHTQRRFLIGYILLSK